MGKKARLRRLFLRSRGGTGSQVENDEAAAAGHRGVGIANDELRALQAFRVIHFSTHQVLHSSGRSAASHHR